MTIFHSVTVRFLTLIAVVLLFTACDDNTFRGPDFSQVPDPVDITGLQADTLANGILLYTFRQGNPANPDLPGLTPRDQGFMRYSSWFNGGRGNVRDSSYEGGFMDPVFTDFLRREIGNGVPIFTGTYFNFIISGMLPGTKDEDGEFNADGEFRVALVPPSVSGLSDTLRYDIELFEILD
ncbi:MAG: hypothetical protein LAT75_09745 [Candidatus Cyclonatronum sp.]|uniref:hypothetical protein n=1 Tax=Cyclonatronum sp. TaxID=3024185 RepID=UPI0025B88D57|nr:hypothetical protein [Cyclonatronum sp.]MCC5934878.1 hypothetical protein [Balneolales bacterium]MCH8487141.1 hypothetical protein [Cyclonatronum sp.]